jgi:hypothetical protein
VKYICLGYHQESVSFNLPESEFHSFMDQCFAYDRELQETGLWAGGMALQPTQMATTLRTQGGRLSVTDGPFAETKEQLGGILLLEANDLNHAIQIMSKHPSIRMGTTWEIRPEADLNEMVAESEARRGVAK